MKNWYINPNRKHEVWIKNKYKFDLYWAINCEVGLMFRKDDLTDPIGEFSLYYLYNNGYKKL